MTRLLLAALASLAVAVPSQAAFVLFTATLTGSQETPPVATPATGFAAVTLDTAANTISWNVTFSNLLGTPTIAHFHLGAPGVAGPVLYDIAPTNPYSSPLIGSATLVPRTVNVGGVPTTFSVEQQKQQLFDGLWYTNLHSSRFPAGEIRGQLTAVPVPPTAALAVLGLAAVAARRRVVG